MRLIFAITISILLSSCSTRGRQEIVVPELQTGFYSDALDQINSKLKSDPSNPDLVEQKLYYCEQLDWPTNCLSALDLYKAKHGMTNQLVVQYVEYYDRHERYQLLLDIIDRWGEEYELEEQFQRYLIKSLVKTRKVARAKQELKNFLIENVTPDDLDFATRQYLNLSDTLMAMYQMSRLERQEPANDLMFIYGKLLVEKGYIDKGYTILNTYHQSQKDNQMLSEALYKIYDENGSYRQAREMLKPFANDNQVAFELAESYQKQFLWDSAVTYIDSVLYRDSLNREAWWRKGDLYENRGWLSFSLRFFERLVKMDSSDTSAAERMEVIQRKIAYLQRQKFEESKVPILEIESIKINN